MSIESGIRTDDELVVAIALGAENYARIAEDFGLSEAAVSDIAAGTSRPELKGRIDQAAQGHLARARRLGCRYASQAMDTLAELASASAEDVSAETRRRAAHDLLKYAFSEGGECGGEPNPSKSCLGGLSREQLDLLAKCNGGPRE